MDPQKPGVYSTEFWLTLIPQVLGVLILLGWVPATEASVLQDAAGKVVVGLATVVTNGVLIYKYIAGRVQVKQAAFDARRTNY